MDWTIAGRLHILVFAERSGDIRIISLRRANHREMRKYYEENA
jgi:uncharacterized DUF497 family protein